MQTLRKQLNHVTFQGGGGSRPIREADYSGECLYSWNNTMFWNPVESTSVSIITWKGRKISTLFFECYLTTMLTAMIMKCLWQVHEWLCSTERAKPKYSEKNLCQCHFAQHKPHTDCPGIEPRPPMWQLNNKLPDPWHAWHFSVGPNRNSSSHSLRNLCQFNYFHICPFFNWK